MNTQPEALRLADALEDDLHADDGTTLGLYSQGIADNAAAELRRLHAVTQELLEALKRMEFAFSPFASDCTLANLIDQARAAIAKAEGGAA